LDLLAKNNKKHLENLEPEYYVKTLNFYLEDIESNLTNLTIIVKEDPNKK